MQDKYIQILLLFCQNYTITEIAKEQKVTVSSIKNSLNQIEKKYPFEFDNAYAMRESCIRLIDGLQNPANYSSLDSDRRIDQQEIKKFIEPE